MKDRAYEISINPKYNGCQRDLVTMVDKFFDKKLGSAPIATSKAGVCVNEQVAQELNKPVIKKFKRRRVYARFKDDIWAEDLADMGSLSSENRAVKYLLCAIDVFTKYAWVKPLKDKKN